MKIALLASAAGLFLNLGIFEASSITGVDIYTRESLAEFEGRGNDAFGL